MWLTHGAPLKKGSTLCNNIWNGILHTVIYDYLRRAVQYSPTRTNMTNKYVLQPHTCGHCRLSFAEFNRLKKHKDQHRLRLRRRQRHKSTIRWLSLRSGAEHELIYSHKNHKSFTVGLYEAKYRSIYHDHPNCPRHERKRYQCTYCIKAIL